ncbi:MAG TPA: GNAT family N-acetyltransferase [Polyangiaceae bacterium]|jgi:ribosomal protein S18 acetylase RimI-like enzyme|nr:GNAT family N-acetyltransferase [Polyangiaceae bacterium]
MTDDVTVRSAAAGDFDDLGVMAGALVRYHHDLDAKRFMIVDGIEAGYARFLESSSRDPKALVLVALRGERRVGYVYARLEPRDWNALRDAAGELHDIFVVAAERRTGVASALLEETKARFTALGAPRVILSTAVQNEAAQRLFSRHGFRQTMIEMTAELSDGGSRSS